MPLCSRARRGFGRFLSQGGAVVLGAFRIAGCHHGEVRDVGALVWLVFGILTVYVQVYTHWLNAEHHRHPRGGLR
jgi:hypothetical protein